MLLKTIKLFLHQHGRLAPFRGRRWCVRPALLLDCVEVVFPALCYVRLYVVTDWLLCQQTVTLFQTLKSESTHTHSTCRHATNSKKRFSSFFFKTPPSSSGFSFSFVAARTDSPHQRQTARPDVLLRRDPFLSSFLLRKHIHKRERERQFFVLSFIP